MSDAAQNLTLNFTETAIDQDKVEERLKQILAGFGFRYLACSGGPPPSKRAMLFERDLCEGNPK